MAGRQHYDIIVIGAGPAGLGAARTAARLGFKTLVLERLSEPGMLGHPCAGMVAAIPGVVSGLRRNGSLYFPALDLGIPARLIRGMPSEQRFISPGGYEFRASFAERDDDPVAIIDKEGLLLLMAEQAEAAGARLQFGSDVVGLIQQRHRVTGVRTAAGERLHSYVVLSAEGVSRHLCELAGLCAPANSAASVVVASQEMMAPRVSAGDLGQVITLGERYTPAPGAFGSVVIPEPDRAIVQFTLLDGPAGEERLWSWFKEFVHRDPRVQHLLKGAETVVSASHRLTVRPAPSGVARDGFVAVGDSVTRAGHLGILPAIYAGRQAALMAAEGLDSGDLSANQLAAYWDLMQGPVLRSIEAEYLFLANMAKLTDERIDRVCEAMGRLSQEAPLEANWRSLAWEVLSRLAAAHLTLADADLDYFRGAVGRPGGLYRMAPVRAPSEVGARLPA